MAPKFEEAKSDRRTDGQTDDEQSDPYVALCFSCAPPPPQKGRSIGRSLARVYIYIFVKRSQDLNMESCYAGVTLSRF